MTLSQSSSASRRTARPTQRLWNVPVQVGTVNRHGDTPCSRRAARPWSQGGCAAPWWSTPPASASSGSSTTRPRSTRWPPRPALPDSTRLKLQGDAWGMVMAGRMQLDSYLKLVGKYGAEPRYAVWDAPRQPGALDRLPPANRSGPWTLRDRPGRAKFSKLGWDEKAGEPTRPAAARAPGGRPGARRRPGRDRGRPAPASRATWPTRPASSPSMIDFVISWPDATPTPPPTTHWQAGAMQTRATRSASAFRRWRRRAIRRWPGAPCSSPWPADVPRLMREDMLGMVAGSGHLPAAWAFARKHADALLADTTRERRRPVLRPPVVDTAASATIADELESFVAARLPAGALADARRAGDEIRTRASSRAAAPPRSSRPRRCSAPLASPGAPCWYDALIAAGPSS